MDAAILLQVARSRSSSSTVWLAGIITSLVRKTLLKLSNRCEASRPPNSRALTEGIGRPPKNEAIGHEGLHLEFLHRVSRERSYASVVLQITLSMHFSALLALVYVQLYVHTQRNKMLANGKKDNYYDISKSYRKLHIYTPLAAHIPWFSSVVTVRVQRVAFFVVKLGMAHHKMPAYGSGENFTDALCTSDGSQVKRTNNLQLQEPKKERRQTSPPAASAPRRKLVKRVV
ncbi:Protein of unknown function [Gryllus bimaculatus]|nr:Protein of unknown function [Gryllus bimaculatus]